MMEKGKCKFNDELLTMTAFKEWVCQDPKGDICSARYQICAKTMNTEPGVIKSADVEILEWYLMKLPS